MSVYDFSARTIDGNDLALSSYRGHALLVVNVASKCGFTPQYARQFSDVCQDQCQRQGCAPLVPVDKPEGLGSDVEAVLRSPDGRRHLDQ